ncbi:MAG: transporter, ATP-binding protein [Labilithrix sp.]|nr:transporter, ATP-binding protein [Labilithrix sp.]
MTITLEGLNARTRGDRAHPAVSLKNVTLTWEKGVLAILGTPADGTTALLEVLAGALPIRGGTATIDGHDPSHARSRVAYVPLAPALPDSLRVEEVCELAGQLRGEPPTTVASRLAPLGLEKLAPRRVRSLSRAEVRAVSLAIALTSRAPVILIEEPLAGLEPTAPARVLEALRTRATDGAAVIVTSASVRDATSLADQLGMLTQGVFTHLPPALAHVGTTGARLRVVVAASAATEVAPFVAALAAEQAITSVETATFAATRVLHSAVSVVVSGADLLAIARAVGAAAAKTRANVEAIESAVMPLDAIRSRIAAPRPGMLLSRPPPAMPKGASDAADATAGSIPPPPRLPGSTPPAPAGSVPPPSGGSA